MTDPSRWFPHVSMLPLAPLAALAALLPAQQPAGGPAAAPPPFVVHEWGTFTSFQGADGAGLEGLQWAEEGLPDFVHTRSGGGDPVPAGRLLKGILMPLRGVTQKMETPVIYFHGTLPPRVQVRVEFVQGLISEWYPAAAAFGPALPKLPQEQKLDLASVQRSFLQWDVELSAPDAPAPEGLPDVDAADPWSFARRVDAAWVRTAGGKSAREAERYLFYRGLGTFRLPVAVAGFGHGTGELRNDGEPLPFAVVLEVGEERVRFQPLGRVDGAATPFDLARGVTHGAEQGRTALQQLLVRELIAAGLFADEAEAMVATWARSWLVRPGTRVLYLVPRAAVDALLPLQIEPAPARIERALLGRLEFLTPEAEQGLLAALAACKDPEAPDEAAMGQLARFDRFLEPVLRRTLAIAPPDHAARGVAMRMLSMLE